MSSTVRNQFASATPANLLGSSVAGKALLALSATALMALAAHISLPLPFSPVPLTMTPFAVLLIGMTFGPLTAFSAMVLYLTEGAIGLPVFTPQGPGGVAQLLGPTAGYLFSYPLAAAAAGWIVRGLHAVSSPLVRGLVAGVIAIAIIFCGGAGWLATLLHLNTAAMWRLAVAPFLPGEVVKIVAAAILYSTMRRRQRSSLPTITE